MIVLDANVLIALADPLDTSHERAVEVLDHHEWDEFLVNAVTLAEVLIRPTQQGWAGILDTHLRRMGILVLPVEDDDPLGIASLSATHGIKTPDAVVLHTAIMTSDALVTFDVRLARAARAAGFPVIERAPDEPDWRPLIAA